MLEVVLQQYEGANDCKQENKKSMVFCTVAAACMDKAGARGHEQSLRRRWRWQRVCVCVCVSDKCQGIAGTQHKKWFIHPNDPKQRCLFGSPSALRKLIGK